MALYSVPDEHYFRIHHPRPRFKGDFENVLIYMATEIVKLGEMNKESFNAALNNAIKLYPGNLDKNPKTINNWRTEIDSLFCFIEEHGDSLRPSRRAKELADNQDLVKFFKLFCYSYQLPGGFIKPEKNMDCIHNKIDFRPACYIVQMMRNAGVSTGRRVGINKAEATHCIFNDLRVTRDKRSVEDTWEIITENRSRGVDYDWQGDVIRYAGDILDYMLKANLMERMPDSKYYLNENEALALERFINPDEGFDYYQRLQPGFAISEVARLEKEWRDYFNREISDEYFDTDIIALVSDTAEDYERLKRFIENLDEIIESFGEADYTTREIGNVGVNIVLVHEKNRISLEGRPDLAYLIKVIPDHLAVGYDIKSIEKNEDQRFVEVKTTFSPQQLAFNRFHLTTNEWNAAKTHSNIYYVYRLMVTKRSIKLVLINDPVGLFRKEIIDGTPRDGMDMIFDPDVCGTEVELLIERAV